VRHRGIPGTGKNDTFYPFLILKIFFGQCR
jgi:hypothetical protein